MQLKFDDKGTDCKWRSCISCFNNIAMAIRHQSTCKKMANNLHAFVSAQTLNISETILEEEEEEETVTSVTSATRSVRSHSKSL